MEIIIDDSTPDHVYQPPAGYSTGLDLSLRTAAGYAGVAEPFPSSLLVPRSEWQARIQEMKDTKSRLSDLILNANLPCKDQNGTNYCWINAPTHCVEIVRLVQNQPMVLLSPASAGGPIKGWSNVGGWGKEGVEFIQQYGLVPVDKWPANAISRSYNTEENRKLAMNYRITEWWELQPGNLDELMSCLFHRIPVAVGYSWWSHEVIAIEPEWMDGEICLRFRNSWGMNYGEKGFSILRGSKMLPNDAVAPRVVIAA